MPNPKLPNEIKDARGTRNVTRDKPSLTITEKDRIATIPPHPAYMNKHAVSEWQTVWSYLIEYRIAAVPDISLIVAYCQEMGKYHEVETKLKGVYILTNPKGYEVVNPLYYIGVKSLENARKIAAEFGFTPVSRSRILLPKKEEIPSEDDITSLID